MTGDQVKQIREALGIALQRRISQADLARMLQLAPASGKDTVRSWEDGKKDVGGPASVALQLLGYGAGVGQFTYSLGDVNPNNIPDIFRAVMLGIAESMLREDS